MSVRFYHFTVRSLSRRGQFNFFWNKKAVAEESKNPDEWKGKEEFLKELREKREEFEKMKIKAQRETVFQDQRIIREHEVNYGKIDYAKVLTENINIKKVDVFQHPEELFHFIGGLRVKLSEQNLVSCMEAFIFLADKIGEQDLKRQEYQEFLAILSGQVKMLSNLDNLVMLTKFLDLYCVPTDNPIWEHTEAFTVSRLGTIKLNQLVGILGHLANQQEGSEVLWDRSENYLLTKLEQNQDVEKAQLTIQALVAYWKVQRGTKEFVKQLFNIIDESLQDEEVVKTISTNSLIQIATVQSALNLAQSIKQNVPTLSNDVERAFNIIEQNLKVDEMEFEQICLTASAFGFKYGSEKFFNSLEDKIFPILDRCALQELRTIIKGFLFSYRGSSKLFNKMKERITAALHEFSVGELSELAKAYHITENEDPEFMHMLEKSIVHKLKDVKVVTIEEIHEIAKSYLITRIGSREMYKLLEIVVKYRFDEIRQNAKILAGLHNLFVRSGLCSPQLIQKFELFM